MACLHGSSPRPGAPNGFWLTLQGILSFLPSALNGWLAWSPDWLDGAYISTADLCAVPQPVVGAFPAADYLACQLSPLTQYGASCAVVRSWFNTYIRSLLWANQCQCDGAPGSCLSRSYRPMVGTNSFVWDDLGTYACSGGESVTLTINWLNNSHGVFGGPYLQLWEYSSPGVLSYPSAYTISPSTVPQLVSGTDHLTSGARLYRIEAAYSQGGGGPTSGDVDFTWCSATLGTPTYLPAPTTPGQPSGIVSIPTGSCATTADLCAELLRVEQYVSELTATVNYLTRQGMPYSYLPGTPVAGLTGNGYVAVTECLGCIVTLTSVPATKGRSTGTPTRYFDVGRINWGDANGYHSHHPLHESPELILGIPDTATRIGYTLPPGVVATITPLRRTGA